MNMPSVFATVFPSQVVPQAEPSHWWPTPILSSPIQGDPVTPLTGEGPRRPGDDGDPVTGDLIRSRPPGVTPAAAIRGFVLGSVDAIRAIPPENWRGELGYLAAISPAVHRLALEMADRQAAALASAISDTSPVPPEIAALQGIALAGVFQIIISEAGRRTREGQSQARIADELYPMLERLMDELDRWLSVPGSSA
jgi:hypothetical protein